MLWRWSVDVVACARLGVEPLVFKAHAVRSTPESAAKRAASRLAKEGIGAWRGRVSDPVSARGAARRWDRKREMSRMLVHRLLDDLAMQHRLPFGTIDLGEGWEDRTAYHFLSPPAPELQAPLAAPRPGGVSSPRLTVVVAQLGLEGAGSLARAIELQQDFFRSALPDVSSMSVDRWHHPAHGEVPVLLLTCAASLEQKVRQVHAYFHQPERERAIVLTISCDARRASIYQAEIQRIFSATTIRDEEGARS
jgi:hypothetical protein